MTHFPYADPQAVIAWLMSRDTGTSSLTICHVMTGVPRPEYVSPPADPDDFGRCFRLLERFPQWRERLKEVAILYPEWTGLVREWPELEAQYRALGCPSWDRGMYDRMTALLDEGRLAAGWVRAGSGWRKGGAP